VLVVWGGVGVGLVAEGWGYVDRAIAHALHVLGRCGLLLGAGREGQSGHTGCPAPGSSGTRQSVGKWGAYVVPLQPVPAGTGLQPQQQCPPRVNASVNPSCPATATGAGVSDEADSNRRGRFADSTRASAPDGCYLIVASPHPSSVNTPVTLASRLLSTNLHS
jgi:hypothetical protein